MKKLISLLLGLTSLAAYAQSQPAPKTGGVALRVNDSTAYISTQTSAHSQGYADIFWNNQATTPHYDIWNGASYDHVFTFSGGGGGSQDLQSVLDEGSTANIGNNQSSITAQDGSNYSQWSLTPSEQSFSSSDNGNTEIASFRTSTDGLQIEDTRANRGIQGTADYSANIQANDFTQKVYVDATANAKVADAINNGTTTIAPSQNAVFDALALKAQLYPATRTETSSTTAVAGDAGGNIEINSASGTTVTIPPASTTDFADNTTIVIKNFGAGVVTVTAGSGVTFLNQTGGVLTVPQYSEAVVHNRTGDSWYVWNGSTILGSTLTSTRVPFANASGLIVDDAELTYAASTDILTVSRVLLAASTASAGTAPIKITSGTLMTTAEAGVFGEYDGTTFYLSPSTTRYRIMYGLTGSVTQDVGSISAQTTSSPSTITVTGAAVGDPVYVGASAITAGTIFSAQVTATNTVTVYITNPTSGALDPPSATYSVRVIKTP